MAAFPALLLSLLLTSIPAALSSRSLQRPDQKAVGAESLHALYTGEAARNISFMDLETRVGSKSRRLASGILQLPLGKESTPGLTTLGWYFQISLGTPGQLLTPFIDTSNPVSESLIYQ